MKLGLVFALGVLGCASGGERSSCAVPVTAAVAEAFMQAAVEKRDAQPRTGIDIDHEASPLSLHGRCLVAVALSWDGRHEGAVVVADSARNVIFSDTTYRGAYNLHVTPRGRLVFQYVAGWGSGLWETRAVVLCPLDTDVWVLCLELTVDHILSIVGTGDPGLYEQHGELRTAGDTLIVVRRVVLSPYDHRWPAESSAAVTLRLPIP